jgi:hypothetical protein
MPTNIVREEATDRHPGEEEGEAEEGAPPAGLPLRPHRAGECPHRGDAARPPRGVERARRGRQQADRDRGHDRPRGHVQEGDRQAEEAPHRRRQQFGEAEPEQQAEGAARDRQGERFADYRPRDPPPRGPERA